MAMELTCQVGDVIKSQRFAQGKITSLRVYIGEQPQALILVGAHGEADDPTRAEARYVVYDVNRGFDVKARRLNPDNSFDPDGEAICFMQRKCQTGPLIRPSDIQAVGKMRQIFIW